MDAVSQSEENHNTRRSSSPIKSIAHDHEHRMEHVQTEITQEENQQLGTEHGHSDNRPQENNQSGSEIILSGNTKEENSQPTSEHVQSECAPQENDQLGCKHVQSGSEETMLGQGVGSTNIQSVEPLARDVGKSYPSSSRKKTKVHLGSQKRTYMLRSAVGSARVLRSRSCGASKAPVHPVAADKSVNVTAQKKKKSKKKSTSRKLNDEFSRTRKRLRYLLHRMSFEQSLIDAYSGEGWKGQSSEKIKPEKELQRAKTEIYICKKKIRNLFQHIDSSCAEGKLQESLFDSDGQISSEDIFCAKCGSKDLTTDNDIILCDGMCDRGFHQMCLEPPLLKEEIPLGDEGWLCPGCDCKVDCIDLLNDSQGIDLSVDDNWEKVFPEAAATVAVKQNDDLGLPSDDSEDDDYHPDGPQDDGKIQSEDSSSEESDFSASEDLEALPNDDPFMGLPSDDSEDDDFDPNCPDDDEKVKRESSSSDFTSDSEDFSASGGDSKCYGADDVPESLSVGDAKSTRCSGETSTVVKKKKQSVDSELQSLLEADPNAILPSGKRSVERLNYKQLHDVTYGDVPSDSSDDEDFTVGNASRKGKSNAVSNCSVSPKTKFTTSANGTKYTKQNSGETENTPKRKTRQEPNVEGANESAHGRCKDGSEPCSSGKLATASPSRLGFVVTKRLSESLRENQYPDRATKEKLVKELGITIRQVSKWFENARRSLRLSANTGVSQAETTSSNKEINSEPAKDAKDNVGEDKRFSKTGSGEDVGTDCSGGNGRTKSAPAESSQKKPAARKSRKRRGPMNDEKSEGKRKKPTKATNEESRRTQATSLINQNPKPELKQPVIQTRSRKSAS